MKNKKKCARNSVGVEVLLAYVVLPVLMRRMKGYAGLCGRVEPLVGQVR